MRHIAFINFIRKDIKYLSLKVKPNMNKITGDHQCGYQCNRSYIDQIYNISQIPEKKWEYNETVHQHFVNFKKAYDSVRREVFYIILVTFKLIKMRLNKTLLKPVKVNICVKRVQFKIA
jgi:hypothetical protein